MEGDRSALIGAATAGAAGLLLFASLFLHWYAVPAGDIAQGAAGALQDLGEKIGVDIGLDERVNDKVFLTGWEAFEITDVFCVAAALVAAVRAAIALLGPDDDPDVPGSMLTLVLGAVALALVAYRTFNPPYVGLDRELGLWIGLFASGAIVYGSYVALRARREASGPSVEARRERD